MARARRRCNSASTRSTSAAVEPVGNYAVKLVFDDGHDSGLYTWDYLYELGVTRAEKWQHYLDRLAQLGFPTRPPPAASALQEGLTDPVARNRARDLPDHRPSPWDRATRSD